MKELKFEAVIFDADGTLFDSKEAFYLMIKDISKRLKWRELGKEEVINLIGLPNKEISRRIVKIAGKDDEEIKKYEKLVQELWEDYYLPKYIKLYPGVKETLDFLRENGVKIALVSNGSKSEIPKYLKYCGVSEFFQVVITSDDVAEPKPSPEPIYRAIEILKVSKEKCLMVGDTIIDGVAARNAGIKVALIDWGIGKREEILNFKPDYVISSIEEIRKIIFG